MRRILMAAAVLALAMTARAAGLRTPFGEVVVKNLKIGQTYSLYKLVNLPIRVVNTGGEAVDLRVDPVPVRPSDVKPGYEAVPTPDWVRVEKSTFTGLEPNREAVTDVIITVPNDPKLLGRRFQADIWSRTTGAHALLVGIRSQLFLHIDSEPPTDEELKKKFVDETVANLDFSVMPVSAQVSDIPVGRLVDLRKERKVVIKIVNPNERALNFRVRSIPVWESLSLPPHGYEEPANPQWLLPEKDVVKIEASSIGDASLKLDLPADSGLEGRHFMFVVSFEVLEQKIPTRFYYRLLVDVAEKGKTKDETKSSEPVK